MSEPSAGERIVNILGDLVGIMLRVGAIVLPTCLLIRWIKPFG